ncbi:MAG: S8 family serine peptidase [Bacteroidia bacterium]|nr:S8 family serine peptidase [Bacteroidia bacterium]
MKKIIYPFLMLFLYNMIYCQVVNSNYVDGQIYLKFKNGRIKYLMNEDPHNIPISKIPILEKLKTTYGITKVIKPFYQADDDANLMHIYQVFFTKHAAVESLIRDLQNEAIVEYAEKVPLMQTFATPNDPTLGAHLGQINAYNAWNIFNGNSNITCAIVDNAIQHTHVDLAGNIWNNPGEIPSNNIDDDGNGYVDDIVGYDVADNDNDPSPPNNSFSHGTHCAGIAGARTNNGIGIAAIGWNIKIISVKATQNTGSPTSVSNGYGGIVYAAKCKARIISCSWGGTGYSATGQSIIDYAWNKGCIVVAAAGNNNTSTPTYPGAYNNVLCVASVNGSNVKSSFSNYGTWVDVSAPGENIRSTWPTNTYQLSSGTSMATPLVAGLAALMLSACPYMTSNDVVNCIKSTAANIYTIAANSTYSPGLQLGTGRIEAYQAMLCAQAFLSSPPIANFYSELRKTTCPGVNVVFKDSSLYAPTSWTWNFQGGTPATSTSSNPTVSWSSPGTYSVSLTVANANGSNTKTKSAYIVITNPQNLPFSENFQGSQFLPTNWSYFNIDNDSVIWKRKYGVGGYTVNAAASCVFFNNYDDDASGFRDQLMLPPLNFSNVARATLRFDVAYKQFDNQYSDTLVVRGSSNCGNTWSNPLYQRGGSLLSTSPGTLQNNIFVPTATEWRTDSAVVNAFSLQPSVRLSFFNHGRWGQALYIDNVNIFLPAPTMSITGLPSNACTGNPYNITNLTIGAVGYTWNVVPTATISSPNGTNTSITFNTPGTYTVSLVANNGPVTNTLTQIVTVNTSPTVIASGSPTNICSGSVASLTASGASSYTWSNGANTPNTTVNPTTTTIYSVTGSNGTCSQTKTVQINVTTTPTVTVNNQTICPGGSATLIASGATSYSWNTGATTSVIVVSPTVNTNYTVTGLNGTCTDTKTLSVTIGTGISPNITASTYTLCAGGTVQLNGTGATNYTWLPGNQNTSNITVTVNSTTTYTLLGSSGTCTGNAVTTISVVPAPSLVTNPASSASTCAGGSVTLSASNYATYTWQPGNINSSSVTVSPTSTQIYTVSGQLGNCTSSKTIQVTVVNYPTLNVSSSPSAAICSGNTVNLTASGATTYSWNTGSTASVISVSPGTTTTYTVFGFNSSCGTVATIQVSVNPNPTLSTSASANPVCPFETTTLTATGANSYTWAPFGLTGNTIQLAPSSPITLTLSGSIGNCTSSIPVSVSVAPSPTLNVSTTHTLLCDGSSATLTASGANNYTWLPSNTSATFLVISPSVTTTYTLIGAVGNCSDQTTFTQSVTVCNGLSDNSSITDFLIYPNPTKGSFELIAKPESNFKVTDATGRTLIIGKCIGERTNISLDFVAPGIYFITVDSGKISSNKKIIKE